MRLNSALAAVAAAYGPPSLFGVLGDGNMFFVESFVADYRGSYLSTANEAGAVMMAAGFAAGSGEVGVATVTHGPGLANAIPALISAARARLPLVLVTGDISVRGHAQNIDQPTIVAPTGAGYDRASSAGTAASDLARAFRRAATERRPIVFDVPVGLVHQEVDPPSTSDAFRVRRQAIRPDPEAMDRAVGLIATARRPIVLGGAGALSVEGIESLRRLGSALGAPLATTLPAKGLFGFDENDLGVFGTLSHRRAAEAIAAADCIVAVGASLSRHTGGGDGAPFLVGKKVVHCDVDPGALAAAEGPVDVPVLSDAATFADTVADWLGQIDHTPTDFVLACGATEHDLSLAVAHTTGDEGPVVSGVGLTAALDVLNRALPTQRSVAVDGGRFSIETIQRIEIPGPRRFAFSAMGFGAVGNGVSTAIGMGVARPASPAIAIVGDGGFMLGGLAEFNTAVRHGIDLVVVVCNDSSYGAEYAKLRARGYEGAVSQFDWPDLVAVAGSLGGAGFIVRDGSDLRHLDRVVAERDRPLLIDVRIDPTSVPYWH